MAYLTTGGTTYRLGASIGSTDATIILSSFYEPISNVPYTMALIGSSVCFGTISPQSTQSEFVSFTGITQNADGTATLTGVIRGLGRSTPYASSSTFQLPHAGQSIFILSDAPEVFAQYAAKSNNETITGAWAFPTPVNPTDVTNKAYVDSVAISGAPDASTVVKGISKLSTAPGDVLGTCTITIASPAVVTLASHGLIAGDEIKFSTTGALPTGITAGNAYFVISTGLTANAFEFSVTSGGTAVNTSGTQSGTQTLTRITPIAVSDTDPRLPTQGENDALVGTSGTPSSSNPFVTKADKTLTAVAGAVPQLDSNGIIPEALLYGAACGIATATSGTQNIAHGLGIVPKKVRFTATYNGGTNTQLLFVFGSYDGTHNSAVTSQLTSSGAVSASSSSTSSAIILGSGTGVATLTSTNIVITWTGTPTAVPFMWEAN